MSSPPPEPAPAPEPPDPALAPAPATTSEVPSAPESGRPPPPALPHPYPYQYAYHPQYAHAPQYAYAPPRPTNTMAILALIFGILVPPAGIILGHLARKQLRERGEEGDTLALVGLVIGYIQTGIIALFCVGYVAFFVIFFSTFAASTAW